MSLRRRILYLLIVTGFLFLIVNIHQKAIWAQTFHTDLDIIPGKKAMPKASSNTLRKSKSLFNKLYSGNDAEVTRVDPDAAGTEITSQKEKRSDQTSEPNSKPWYMKGGVLRPKPAKLNRITRKRMATLWPHEDRESDRVLNQLMFVPPGEMNEEKEPPKLKKILFYFGLNSWSLKPGRSSFLESRCPVNTCTLTGSQVDAETADAVVFKERYVHPGTTRPKKQVWILYMLECPYHTQQVKHNDLINWTATYRMDSDIVTPYERWVYYDPEVRQKPVLDRNYAANKTKKVAWFVSNCAARNNRAQYAKELKKHIQVDIYGSCGEKKCPRYPSESREQCFEMLEKDYKFYLAFENSNCRDYITEKFFVNGLGHNVLPIVMGAHPDDYHRSAPEHSYLHVEQFETPRDLAMFLHKLDQDDELYNTYFRWKGTGEFINTHFLCRLCAMLHDDVPAKSYRDINDWWRGHGICSQGWKTYKLG